MSKEKPFQIYLNALDIGTVLAVLVSGYKSGGNDMILPLGIKELFFKISTQAGMSAEECETKWESALEIFEK